MNTYLISGLSGTGKTTIQAELDTLGYDTLDTDTTWGYFGNLLTEKSVERPADADRAWYATNGWVWESEVVHSFLSLPREEPLFVCGGSRNEEKFYDLFTKIFMLHVPDDVMQQRLRIRQGNQAATDLYIERMVEFNQNTYKRAQKVGVTVIETTEPLDVCVQQIVNATHEDKPLA